MGLYKKLRKYITGRRMVWPPEYREGMALDEINIRDPFIVNPGEGGYLMTGTIYHYNYNDSGMCVCYKSEDLRSWRGPFTLIDGKNSVYSDFWAAEIHRVGDKFCLLITLHPKGGKRGVYLFTSDRADGGYKPIARLTPEGGNCLDGTMLVKGGKIYFTYCREYIDVKDGQILCSVYEEKDFDLPPADMDKMPCIARQGKLLFKGSDNTFRPTLAKKKVTDGPFYYEHGGELYLLWSTHLAGGTYALLAAKSVNGEPDGEFTQLGAVYDKNGGHAMIFKDKEGRGQLVLHAPNAREVFGKGMEHAIILPADKIHLRQN